MEKLTSLVSVVLPVRVWRDHSALAIHSILQQSYSNIELLLIGQTCLDSLTEGLNQAGINDARIRLVQRAAPGIVGALNTGLLNATGQFIARMDDDDIAYPERLRTQLQYLQENPDIHLCAGRVRFVDKHGSTDGVGAGNQHYANWLNQWITPAPIALACYAENPMPHPTLLAHRNVWRRLDGYCDVDGPEDHDLIVRAMLMGLSMGKPEGIVLDWREHDERLTRTDSRYRRRAFVARSAQALTQARGALADHQQRAVWIAGTGKQARHWHDELVDAGVTVRGFVDMSRPGKMREKRHRRVITYQQLIDERTDELVLSAVTQPAGRNAIRQFCKEQNWREGSDFIIGS